MTTDQEITGIPIAVSLGPFWQETSGWRFDDCRIETCRIPLWRPTADRLSRQQRARDSVRATTASQMRRDRAQLIGRETAPKRRRDPMRRTRFVFDGRPDIDTASNPRDPWRLGEARESPVADIECP